MMTFISRRASFTNIVHLLIGLSLFVINGCAVSQYRVGYHYFSQENIGWSYVSEKSTKNLREFEVMCMNEIAKNNLVTLKPYFAPKLKSGLSNDEIRNIEKLLEGRYQFNGQFEPIRHQFP